MSSLVLAILHIIPGEQRRRGRENETPRDHGVLREQPPPGPHGGSGEEERGLQADPSAALLRSKGDRQARVSGRTLQYVLYTYMDPHNTYVLHVHNMFLQYIPYSKMFLWDKIFTDVMQSTKLLSAKFFL